MHINEEILEKFYLAPESFSVEEKNALVKHLEDCNQCSLLFDNITDFINSIDMGINEEPTSNDKAFALKIKNKLENVDENKQLPEKNNSVELFNGKAEIVSQTNIYSLKNIYKLIKSHPFTSFSFASICLMAAAYLVTTIKTSFKDKNPATLEIKHSVLYSYNEAGELLWSKNVDGIYAEKIDSVSQFIYGKRKLIGLVDIDNDGKNEILLTGTYVEKGTYRNDSLYCINYDGSKRWTISPEDKKFNYAPKWKRTNWCVSEFFTAKQNGKPILYVLANVETYGGTVLSTLDPNTGNVTSSLYHSGHYSAQFHYDIDNDGSDEIFLGGISSYDKPFLMVLKQDFLMGVMPDFYSTGHKVKGNAWHYILMPVTKLSLVAGVYSPSNVSEIKRFEKNGIVCYCDDVPGQTSAENKRLLFSFDKNFRIKFINYTSQYNMLYDEMIKKGKITEAITPYLNSLKDSIKYWDGDKFVNYPTPNKYWNQKFQKP